VRRGAGAARVDYRHVPRLGLALMMLFARPLWTGIMIGGLVLDTLVTLGLTPISTTCCSDWECTKHASVDDALAHAAADFGVGAPA
jgi:hypothetical protein